MRTHAKHLSLSIVAGALGILSALPAHASSHREAPNIARMPTVDSTDFYAFNSYEAQRGGYVTVIANYIPLQDPYGGPNYFAMHPDAKYAIHIDNDGDAIEDLTYVFDFSSALAGGDGIALNVGPEGNTKSIAVPLKTWGQSAPAIKAQLTSLKAIP